MTDRPAETITAFVAAVLGLLVAFGINLTDDQIAAILVVVGFVPAGITLIVSARNRGKTPPQ